MSKKVLGIEGLRAVAVISVILYHANIYWLFPGGFLGVDIFFSISGYLITSIIVEELSYKSNINLPNFYWKRVKRLMPALYSMLIVVYLLSFWFAQDSIDKTFKDIQAAFLYYSNWWQIYSNQSYFEASGRPALLQHLWSLAIEEQFYLFWPACVLVALKVTNKKILAFIAIALSIFSTALMAFKAITLSIPVDNNPSEIYLRTDTHIMGLFLGAFFACIYPLKANDSFFISKRLRISKSLIDILGMISIVILIIAMQYRLENLSFLYRGGFLFFNLLACIAIIASVTQGSISSIIFSNPLLTWIGTRSYSLYLWHWPIFMLLRPGFELPDENIYQILRLFLTVVAAEISYRFIENPFRSNKIFSLNRYKKIGIILALIFLVITIYIKQVQYNRENSQKNTVSLAKVTPPKIDNEIVKVEPLTQQKQCEKNTPIKISNGTVLMTAIGDSVLLGAKDKINKKLQGVEIDAVVGRQGKDGLNRLKELKAQNKLADKVLIHLGTNGFLNETNLREMLDMLKDKNQVILVNIYAPRKWESDNNLLLTHVAKDYANVQIIDWYSIVKAHANYLGGDHVHPNVSGMNALVDEIKLKTNLPLLHNEKDQDNENCN